MTREQFGESARHNTVVPVTRGLLADYITPVAMFARLCGEQDTTFLLESVDHGGQWGRWSFIGRNPAARAVCRDGATMWEATGSGIGRWDEALGDGPPAGALDAMERLLAACTVDGERDLPPLHSGMVGYLGYDVVREIERLDSPPPDPAGLPDAILSVIGELAAYDHWRQQVTLVVNVWVGDNPPDEVLDALWAAATDRLDGLAADGAGPLAEPLIVIPEGREQAPLIEPSLSADAYGQAVEVAKEYILAGDIFQVVLSTRYEVDIDADPFDIYRVLRQINPSPYMYFVREPETVLIGCSPEPMVTLRDRKVISRPIAGTRFRGATDDQDRRMAAELREHPKERAEHIMLVDLARNDVGRVVEFGTCEVDELMTLERYSHVMHLTSQVSGTLAQGKSPVDVLRATLPAGTVSGAPKIRAMEIIDELEPVRRGPYAGLVGYLDFSGNIDTAIAIRTMVLQRSGDRWRGAVQAGAGIVADSDPRDEFLETRNKANALLTAVPLAESVTRQRRARKDGSESS